jgi:hypothetical protein
LNPQELLTVISFIQSQGGKITVKPEELMGDIVGTASPIVAPVVEEIGTTTPMTDGAAEASAPAVPADVPNL